MSKKRGKKVHFLPRFLTVFIDDIPIFDDNIDRS